MSKSIFTFIIRWLFNSLGLYAAVRWLGAGNDSIPLGVGVLGYLIAGLIFSIVNSVLKPFVVVLALPAIALSLGLFMIVVNGLMVYISVKISPNISMTFLNSIFTGILLGLINYIIDITLNNHLNGAKRRNA